MTRLLREVLHHTGAQAKGKDSQSDNGIICMHQLDIHLFLTLWGTPQPKTPVHPSPQSNSNNDSPLKRRQLGKGDKLGPGLAPRHNGVVGLQQLWQRVACPAFGSTGAGSAGILQAIEHLDKDFVHPPIHSPPHQCVQCRLAGTPGASEAASHRRTRSSLGAIQNRLGGVLANTHSRNRPQVKLPAGGSHLMQLGREPPPTHLVPCSWCTGDLIASEMCRWLDWGQRSPKCHLTDMMVIGTIFLY